MKGLAASADIGWVRVDAKPLKKALETMVSKWSWTWIKYLQDKVVNEMDDLYAFMGNANHVLDLSVRVRSHAQSPPHATPCAVLRHACPESPDSPAPLAVLAHLLRSQVDDELPEGEGEGAADEPPEGVDVAALKRERADEARRNLYAIMGAMRDIRVRDERTSKMFAPMKEMVQLLQQYGASRVRG